MTDKTTNISKAKCHKVKNPCKICFQRVSHKNGLRCEGACKRWVHYKCLQYTPGRIADIKAGIIKVTCPCPDCSPSPEPKEFLTNPPYTCTDIKCPANQIPKCTSSECPKNMEQQGEGANKDLNPGSNERSGSTRSNGSLPPSIANEPRPFKLHQPSRASIRSAGNASRAGSRNGSRDGSPDTSYKAKLIAVKDELSAVTFGKLCPCNQKETEETKEKEEKSPLGSHESSPLISEDNISSTCNNQTCKNSALAQTLDPGMAQGMSQGKAQGMSQGTSQGMSQGKAQETFQGMSQGKAQGMSQGTSQGMSQGKAQGMSQGKAQGMSQRTSQGMSQRISQAMSEIMSQEISQEKTQGMCHEMCQGMSQEMAQEMHQRKAECVSKISLKPCESNQSLVKVQFQPPCKMDAPQKSTSFEGVLLKKSSIKTKKAFNKNDCQVSTSDSVIQVTKGQDSLLTSLDEMCKTVGRLACQIRDIICKLDGAT